MTRSGRVVGQSGVIGRERQFGCQRCNATARCSSGVGRCPNRIPLVHRAAATSTRLRRSQAALQRCVDSFHLREVVTYQPPSHYWPLQWSEAAIFVALAIALGAACVWWVRRRLP